MQRRRLQWNCRARPLRTGIAPSFPILSHPGPPLLRTPARQGVLTPLTIATDTFLTPGTYCGGIVIQGAAQVRLQPGVYAIKDGPLIISRSAKLTGTDVGLYFAGELATMDMKKDFLIV